MNVNEATREDLLSLDGVGDRLARDILAARPFDSLDDLRSVPGIGEQRLASLRRQGLTAGSDEPVDDDGELPSLEDLDLPPPDDPRVGRELGESPLQLPPTLQRQVQDTSQLPPTGAARTGLPTDLFEDTPTHQTAPHHQTAPYSQTTADQGWSDAGYRPADADAGTDRVTDTPSEETHRDTATTGGRDANVADDGEAVTAGSRAESRAPGSRPYVAQTLLLSAAFYLVLLAIYVLTDPPELTEEHVLIALMPFLILLIASGKLREIRGPGGLMVTLQNEARSDVLPEFTEDLEMGEQRPIEKGGTIDSEFEAEIERRRPTSLTFTLGRTGYYDFDVITQYVEVLSRKSPAFRYVVFLETDDRFAGFMHVADFRAVLDADLAAAFRSGASYDYLPGRTSVVERIESGDILNAAGVVTASVRHGSTNEEALSVMKAAGVDRLAVLDDRDRFLGVITQERIGRTMLLKLFQRANPA